QLKILTEMLESEVIKPTLDKVFIFEDAQKALEYAEAGRAKGKIILKLK
ncbi:zinc-binding dehydrogenase, partial [Peribacillus simplex]